MKLLARILLILLVNKLNVHGEPILQNNNLTAEHEAFSRADKHLKSATETPVKQALTDELENDKNRFLQNTSELEEWPLTALNINLTRDNTFQLDSENKSNLTYQPPEMAAVKNITAKLESERKVTAKTSEQVFPDTDLIAEEHADIETKAEVNVSAASTPNTIQNEYTIATQKVSTESQSSFLDFESHSLVSTQTRDLLKQQEDTRDADDAFSKSLIQNTTDTQNVVSCGTTTNLILHEKTRLPKALTILAETQNNHMDQYEISSLSSNITKDLPVFKVRSNEQKHGRDNFSNFNQSWPENRAKTINEYRLATKPLDSNDFSQSYNLKENELIEIVLKEATNLNKKAAENHLSPDLASPNIEISAFNSTKSALTVKALEESNNLLAERNENASTLLKTSVPISNNELVPIVLKPFEGSVNYSAEVTNLSKALEETTAISKEQLGQRGLEGLASMNHKQAEATSSLTKSALKLETNLSDNHELTSTTPNSLTMQTLNDPKHEESKVAAKAIPNSSQIEEKYFVATLYLENTNELSPSYSDSFMRQQPARVRENKPENVVLNLHKSEKARYSNSLEALAETNTTFKANNDLTKKSFDSFKAPQSFIETESKLKAAILKETTYLNKTGNAKDFKPLKDFSLNATTILSPKLLVNSVKDDDMTTENLKVVLAPAAKELSTKPFSNKEYAQNLPKSEKYPEKATNLSEKVTQKAETSPSANVQLNLDPWNKLAEASNYAATERNSPMFSKQQYSAESSSPEEEEEVSMSKPIISLEEYAVKQMNFILDHLLLETQKFVAKVLQATINSVFPRDRLKHYAEGVNQLLNPVMESDYSDDVLEHIETASQDEIYEQIVEKLDFLKSKPSRYLQKQIPPEWLNEFRDKRAELAIWLDKAAVEMHKEFNGYIIEEQDPIKYQYFNESFDDISRATEIHHKLALMADLVKIIKNKKQITFMDLYMQT